jgi:hypothetical protein
MRSRLAPHDGPHLFAGSDLFLGGPPAIEESVDAQHPSQHRGIITLSSCRLHLLISGEDLAIKRGNQRNHRVPFRSTRPQQRPVPRTSTQAALSRYLKCIVAQLIVELWRWISVGALAFQAAALSAVASRQTAKRSAISVRH